jgi:hypothetical protein|tara:strand:+ start:2033 stop:4420 length:2388 start_codon:yes stop_codon:yes gene_type:complete
MPTDDVTGGGFQVVVEEMESGEIDPEAQQQDEIRVFLQTAQSRFKTVVDAESSLRQNMLEDLEFRASEQWPDSIKSIREQDNRPCLTINRIPQFIRQVTNNQRASRPAVQVHPAGDVANVELSEVMQGIVRHIEDRSDADVAYTTAGDHQVTMGRGYIRVMTDYIDDDPVSLNQEIKIGRVVNPFSIYVDPTAQSPDASDARYAFVIEDIPVAEYRFRYPNSELAELSEFTGVGNQKPEWMPEGNIRIAEYFYVEETREEMVLIMGPQGTTERYPKSLFPSTDPADMPEGVTIVAEREVTTRTVKWALINAVEVLDGNEEKTGGLEWPGKYIPIVPVLGDEININGVTDYRGIVRDAKDPQRMYNYWVSAETELIALAPRAPIVGAEGQFEGHESKWRTANVRNYPYLEYKPRTIAGQLAPPPQRQSWEPPIQAIAAAIQQSDNDLKATGGFNDASLGVRGAQESGKAIRSRQQQDEMANSHYLDNLARAIRQVGRVIVDLIPRIYDTARVMRITGIDEKDRTVMVYAGDKNKPNEEQMEQIPPAVEKIYDVSSQQYDVTISVGPSFQTRRQEALDSLVQFVQAYPNAFPMIGDLLAENMDWPGAKQVAARLKKMLPPKLQDDLDPSEVPPQVQAKMQGMEKQLKQVMEAYQKTKQALDTDQAKAQAQVQIKQSELAAKAAAQERDLQAKLQLEEIKQQGESARTLAKIDQSRASELLQTEIQRLNNMITRNLDQSNREQDIYEKRMIQAQQKAQQQSKPPPPKPQGGGPKPQGGGPGQQGGGPGQQGGGPGQPR